MHKYSKDIMWGFIAIVVVMFFLTGKIYIFPIIIIVCLAFSLGRDESQYYENRPHDDSEIETPSQSDYERPSYSLHVDESLFWENQHHDDDLEPKTDYSQVDPCFRGDQKNRD